MDLDICKKRQRLAVIYCWGERPVRAVVVGWVREGGWNSDVRVERSRWLGIPLEMGGFSAC